MTQHQERLPALGQPVEEPAPEADNDFAGEHDSTTVSDDVMTGDDAREEESPRGWAGMDQS